MKLAGCWSLVLGGLLLGACSEEPAGPGTMAGAGAPTFVPTAGGAPVGPLAGMTAPVLPMMGTAGVTAAGAGAVTAGSPANPGAAGGGAGSGGSTATSAGSGGMTAMAGSTAAAGAAGSTPASGMPMQVKITARQIAPNGENHVCVVMPLPNTERAFITSIHATLTDGSHHLIVDRVPAGTPTQSEATVCPPTQGMDATRLIIAQQHDTTLTMPPGTGLAIEPKQPVFLQLHYINLKTAPIDIVGTVEVTLADPSGPPPKEVKSLFQGDTSLSIPKGQAASGEFFIKPAGSAQKPLHVFALTSHTHSLGTKATIERVASASAPASTPVHESLDWAEPPLTRFDPPLQFNGSDGLRLRCNFMNDTQQDVRFGTRFEDEMCFLWLYYYE